MAVPALLVAAAVATFTVDASTQGVLVEDHRAPIVELSIEIPAGKWSPWVRSHHGEDAWAYQLADPDRALRKRADALAATVALGMTDRFAYLRVQCLKADLPAALRLAWDILENTRYDEQELKRERRKRPILWRANETDVAFLLTRATARNLFADGDPRRLPFEGPEPVETDVARLVATRDVLVRLPGRVIGFAGDLTREEAVRAAEGLLPEAASAAPDGIAPRLLPVTPASSRVKEQDIHVRKLTQVYFRLGRDSLPWSDPRRPEFLVADHVLGGHFYSRLYDALRHEAGDTYGAGTSDRGDVVPGMYVATTFTRAGNAEVTEVKLREVMTKFRNEGITETERAAAVSFLRGNRAFHAQSAGDILRRFLGERRLGLAPGYLDDLPERASTKSLDEINAFIREFYDPTSWSMVRAVAR